MKTISNLEKQIFGLFVTDTCYDISIVSMGESSIFFTDAADKRPKTIMFGLHKTDNGKYFFTRYVHDENMDMDSISMFMKNGEQVLFDCMEKSIEAYSTYRFNVL